MEEETDSREEEHSNSDESVYDEDSREDQVEDDGISPEEEAFMKGYDEASDYSEGGHEEE